VKLRKMSPRAAVENVLDGAHRAAELRRDRHGARTIPDGKFVAYPTNDVSREARIAMLFASGKAFGFQAGRMGVAPAKALWVRAAGVSIAEEFRRVVPLIVGVAIFALHVLKVVFLRARPEVCGVDACAHIAGMADEDSGGQRAVEVLVEPAMGRGCAVGVVGSRAVGELSVSLTGSRSCPEPTAGSIFDVMASESLDVGNEFLGHVSIIA